MSAFNPGSYEEAKATHKPMSRRKPLKSVGQGDSSFRGPKTAGRRHSAPKHTIPRKRARLIPLPKLKKKVWREFSVYVRASAADEDGFVQCVTCPARYLWNSGEIHAGHWIHNRLDYDERNVHPQCVRCNYHWNTKVAVSYSIFMARTYGVTVMEELQLLANTQGNRYSRAELEALLNKFRALNATNPIVKEAKAA